MPMLMADPMTGTAATKSADLPAISRNVRRPEIVLLLTFKKFFNTLIT